MLDISFVVFTCARNMIIQSLIMLDIFLYSSLVQGNRCNVVNFVLCTNNLIIQFNLWFCSCHSVLGETMSLLKVVVLADFISCKCYLNVNMLFYWLLILLVVYAIFLHFLNRWLYLHCVIFLHNLKFLNLASRKHMRTETLIPFWVSGLIAT